MQWRPIVAEHFEAVLESGLLDELAEPIRVGIVGPLYQRTLVSQWLFENYGKRVVVVSSEQEGFEQVTLHQLWQRTLAGSVGILYAHTKGVAHPSVRQDQWRREMTDLLVNDWRRCVRLLTYTEADVVGAYRILNDGMARDAFGDGADEVAARLNAELGTDLEVGDRFPEVGQAIFAGNFWWASGSWIRSLNEPSTHSRYDAETWVASANRNGVEPKLFNLKAWEMK